MGLGEGSSEQEGRTGKFEASLEVKQCAWNIEAIVVNLPVNLTESKDPPPPGDDIVMGYTAGCGDFELMNGSTL